MDTTTLPARIANRLRRDILRGALPPGAPIKERDSALELGVSRTPLREAIRLLAREGLVDLKPGRSPRVADPTLGEVTDAIEVLRALELLSGRLACAAMSEDEIAAIRAIHDRMQAAQGRVDPLDLFEIDMSFHRGIVEATHNATLIRSHTAILAQLWRARYLSARKRHNRARLIKQHHQIMSGLEARDVPAVEAAIGAHLRDLAANIAEHYRPRSEETEQPAGGNRP